MGLIPLERVVDVQEEPLVGETGKTYYLCPTNVKYTEKFMKLP